jgi:GGDEF domain-containing protein
MNCAYWDGTQRGWGQVLSDTLREFDPKMFPFKRLSQIVRIARATPIDVVVVPCPSNARKTIEIACKLKSVPSLTVTPVIIWHPEPDPDSNGTLHILESTVDDLVTGAMDDPNAQARLRLAVRRSMRDLDVNPSSRLPGPTTIERVLRSRVGNGSSFAVCYADLDDFKAYNDYYGYFYGDKVIKMTARIIRETVFEMQADGFVGHIGGDDFVFVVDPAKAEKICTKVLGQFDSEIGSCYDPRDRRNGFIISRNRRSVAETFPLMGLSIAVVVDKGSTFKHVGEISHMVADLKKYAKTLPGSNYVVERRAKY